MKIPFTATRLIATASLFLIASCASRQNISSPISIVSPAPNSPHLILTANKSMIEKGEAVDIIVTLVNPTKERILLPTSLRGKDGYDSLQCSFYVNWEGKNGDSSTRGGTDCISACPPSLKYLGVGERKSYRLQWRAEGLGEGVVTLSYKFGWSDDFPLTKITLEIR